MQRMQASSKSRSFTAAFTQHYATANCLRNKVNWDAACIASGSCASFCNKELHCECGHVSSFRSSLIFWAVCFTDFHLCLCFMVRVILPVKELDSVDID